VCVWQRDSDFSMRAWGGGAFEPLTKCQILTLSNPIVAL
jgi:hypothetical protein